MKVLFILKILTYFGVIFRRALTDFSSLEKSKCKKLIFRSPLKSKGEIKPVMPEKKANRIVKDLKVAGWPFSADIILFMIKSVNTTKEIELASGVKLKFVYIPAGQFIMGNDNSRQPDVYPASKVEIKKSVDDGSMHQVASNKYKPNSFGLYPESLLSLATSV